MLSYNPTLFNAAANRLFIQGAQEVAEQSYVPRIATVYSTDRNQEVYGAIGSAPAMSEFKGEIVFNPVGDRSMTVANKKYTAGFQVSTDAFDDDQLGGFAEVLSEMGAEAVLFPNYLLMQALIDATATTGVLGAGLDGVSLLNDAHPAWGAAPAQDNLLAGAGTTTANIKADLHGKVIPALTGFVKSSGTGHYYHRGLMTLAICHPPSMREAMIEAVSAPLIGGGNSNVAIQGLSIDLIGDPQLEDADATDWYALATGGKLRPLILQQRTAFQLVAEAANTGADFVAEVKRWKSKWRGAVAPGPWHCIVKVVNG